MGLIYNFLQYTTKSFTALRIVSIVTQWNYEQCLLKKHVFRHIYRVFKFILLPFFRDIQPNTLTDNPKCTWILFEYLRIQPGCAKEGRYTGDVLGATSLLLFIFSCSYWLIGNSSQRRKHGEEWSGVMKNYHTYITRHSERKSVNMYIINFICY